MTWGSNSAGQLGLGDTDARVYPTSVYGIYSATAIAAGWFHTLALKDDGTVWAWGYDDGFGNLGNGSRLSSTSPLQVHFDNGVNSEPRIVKIAAGSYHSFAIDENGDVWAWGANNCGQLGDGTRVNRLTPVKVPALAGADSISAGNAFSFMIRELDGTPTVYGWGYNGEGNLGLGMAGGDVLVPVIVPNLSPATTVAAGMAHVLALQTSGAIEASGANDARQVADSDLSPVIVPMPVVLPMAAVAVAAGQKGSVAITEDGKLWEWGRYEGTNAAGEPAQVDHSAPARQEGFSAQRVEDSDGDGIPNWREDELGTNRYSNDTDGDGIPDNWEVDHQLDPTNANTGDTDGDGLSDMDEYKYGSDPNNRDSDGDGVEDGPDGWPTNPVLAPPRVPEVHYVPIDVTATRIFGVNNSADGLVYYPVDRNPDGSFPPLHPTPDTLFLPARFNNDGILGGSFAEQCDGFSTYHGYIGNPGNVGVGQQIVVWGDHIGCTFPDPIYVGFHSPVHSFNRAGQALVYAWRFDELGRPDGLTHLGLWNAGNITDLGVSSNGQPDFGAMINEQGSIVARNQLWRDGNVTTLPFTAVAIADRLADGTELVTGCRDYDCWVWRDGQAARLPKVDPYSPVLAMNNAGQILGTEYHQFAYTPILWQNGLRISLMDIRVTSLDGWNALVPTQINDRGMMFGRGLRGDAAVPMLLLPAELTVDANRDGEVTLGRDTTSEATPYRFWINDDDDQADGTEQVPVVTPDNADALIDGKRDLEDFTRLHLYIGGLQDAIRNGDIQVQMEWKNVTGGPAVWLYRSYDREGSDSYLKEEAAANNQVGGSYGVSFGRVAAGQPLAIDKAIFQYLTPDSPKTCFLFEGAGEGKGQLVFTLWKDGQKIGDGPGVWLDLKNIKRMYQRGDISGHSQWPNVTFEADPDETNQTIVFVHGWNQSPDGASNFAETMFKRLWNRGFKGRYAAVRWNTHWSSAFNNVPGIGQTLSAYLADYNDSEHEAWLAGEALKSFVISLPGATKNVIAHSMGNVVVGGALRRGMTIDNYALLHGAVPASCYDTGSYLEQPQAPGAFGYTYWDMRTPDDDLGPLTRGLAYRGRLAATSGNLVNFYLPQDRATTYAWEFNNRVFKPQARFFYDRNELDGSRLWKNESFIRRSLTDPEEAMPYADQSWSKLVGAESRTAGSISGSVDLNALFGFIDEHSAEFDRNIQRTEPFTRELLRRLGISQNQ